MPDDTKLPDLRHRTISWLVASAGELQRRVAVLGRENAALRSENKRLRAGERTQKAMAKSRSAVTTRWRNLFRLTLAQRLR
jgi:regulator of replication initiation timing